MNVTAVQPTGQLSCSVCGRSSTLREAFSKGRDGTVRHTRCPLCQSRFHEKYANLTLVTVLFLLLMVPALMQVAAPSPVTSTYFILAAAYLTVSLMSLPHELGHALAGRWVGFAPVSITVGDGKLLFDRSPFGVRLRIGRGLRGGATYLDVREAPNFKARMIAVLAAGPAVNLVAAAAGFIAASVHHPSPHVRELLIGFGVGNLLQVVVNLWPHAARTPVGWMPTDGAQILGQLVDVPINLRERRAGIQLLRALLAYHDRDFEGVKRATAAVLPLEENPELAAQLLALRAEAFSESGEPRAAMELLSPALARTDHSDESRAHLDQAYAWAVLLADDSSLLEDALARVARSAALTPWSDVVLIKHICLLAVTSTAIPERPNPERLIEARRGLEQLRDFRLDGESVGYATLARGLVAAASGDSALARAEYNAARNASVSATALNLLERRLANP